MLILALKNKKKKDPYFSICRTLKMYKGNGMEKTELKKYKICAASQALCCSNPMPRGIGEPRQV